MIEKLDKKRHHSEIDIVIKVNELIESLNKLEQIFYDHTHQIDNNVIRGTTKPKFE